MSEVSERLARLEGTYEYLATKADIAELKGSFRTLLLGAASVLALINIGLRFWPQ